MFPSFFQEKQLLKKGCNLIAGIDEAGRGSWAGPLVVACVVFSAKSLENKQLKIVKDSKQISSQKREELFEIICKNCLNWSIGIVSEREIDKIGLTKTTLKAIKKALDALSLKPDFLLIDALSGNKKELSFEISYQTFVKGDEKIFSIAAASILAKVSRDRILKKLALVYPQYGFEENKGYGTKLHQEALKKYGPCQVHRKSFKPVKDCFLNLNRISENKPITPETIYRSARLKTNKEKKSIKSITEPK